MIFAVLDPSPLTVCINCSFFTFTMTEHQPAKLTVSVHTDHTEQKGPRDARDAHTQQ